MSLRCVSLDIRDRLKIGRRSVETTAQARALLCEAMADPSAVFREGQLEAIEALVDENARLLVVQRTGWGKSMVYFVATAILRSRGRGPTLIVSPLLSLMRNQMAAADRLGLHAVTINSANADEHESVLSQLTSDAVDLLLIAPERFANAEFRERVFAGVGQRVGMFVVDEAHCISDWGHDFRPDYRRIARIVQVMPANLPVLATTATANARVVEDVFMQIGEGAQVIRGTLRRDSLRLQNIELPSYAHRLAWLAHKLPTLPGSGIIYVLTKRDAEIVSLWLSSQEINAPAYHSDSEGRAELEQALIDSNVKALVATTALGMGFDKPDLGFVIHFQRPGSVIHYYQQVGRAGRAIPEAYGVLLAGAEDDDIAEYFIRNAALAPSLMAGIVDAIRDASETGLSSEHLASRFNLRKSRVAQALKVLETDVPSPVVKEGYRWYATPVDWHYDEARAEALIAVRRAEQRRMSEYVEADECLQVFLARELDSDDLRPCGECAVCAGHPIVPTGVDDVLVDKALDFLGLLDLPITPRKQWPGDALEHAHGWRGTIAAGLRCEEGRALCRWGDPRWGELVRRGKIEGRFDDALVEAGVQLIANRWIPEPAPEWVTCVPSLRHGSLVPDFAERIAARLGLPFLRYIEKTQETRPQKDMNNSWNQARNLAGAFRVVHDSVPATPGLLIDDMVDSRWTFTIIGALLREAGSGPILPFALADSSQAGD